MARVILHADDFGASKELNEAVKKAIRLGMVSRVSVMTTMPYFAEAVEFLKKNPQVKVGLHFNLTELKEHRGVGKVLWSLSTGKLSLRRIENLLYEQYELLRKTGLPISHIDSHEHIHAFLPVYLLVKRFARYYGISRVRGCQFSADELKVLGAMRPGLKQLVIWLCYGISGLFGVGKKTDGVLYDLNWPNFDQKKLNKLLQVLPENSEIICHLSSEVTRDPLSVGRFECFSFLQDPVTIKVWKKYVRY